MTMPDASRAPKGVAVILAVAAFLAYAVTLAPGLTGGDSGELICAAADLGVAHPPGYPLWTLLGHCFSWLPFGSVATRLNLFSAACAAATAGVLCRVIQIWTRQTWAGVCGAGLFASAPLVWEYARQAEVFALNNLLPALVLASATRFATAPSATNVFLCALASGLALAHHHTALFLVMPVAVWVFVRMITPARGRWQRLGVAVSGAMTGLLPYAYLPLATHFSRGWVWGECDSLGGFLTHFLRREYGTFQLASGDSAHSVSLWLLLRHYCVAAFPGLTYVGVPLAVAGIGTVLFRKTLEGFRALAFVVTFALISYLFLFQSLVNLTPNDPLLAGVLARFWMFPDLLLAVFAGIGFAVWLPDRACRQWAAPAIAILLVVGAAALHGRELPAHSDIIAQYGRAILFPLPTNSVLLVRGDLPANAIRYAQSVDHFRQDVAVLDSELLTREWYVRQMKARHGRVRFPGRVYNPADADGFSIAKLVSANTPALSCWLYPEPKLGDPGNAELILWPRGFAQEIRLNSDSTPEALADWASANRSELQKLRAQFAIAITNPPGTWERITAQDYWSAEHRHAFTSLRVALADSSHPALLVQARDAYKQFVAECPENVWYAWKNLGLIYERLVPADPTAKADQVAAWREYVRLAPTTDPDYATVTEFLRRNP